VSDYEKTLYLTFDIDWASDPILADTLDLLEREQIAATFFVTHETPLLARLRRNVMFELGIHPNFNGLLQNGQTEQDATTIIGLLKDLVPEAVSIRSHSLMQSTRLLDYFREHGLTHETNLLVPMWSGIRLAPFKHWNGLTRVPYFWADDAHCVGIGAGLVSGWEVEPYLESPGLKVVAFHPVHVFLNTDCQARYEAARPYGRNLDRFVALRCPEDQLGTRWFLRRLICQAKERSFSFRTIREITV
jgi:hypothetical protein